MPRTCELVVSCDTGMFSPVQLHTVSLLRLGFWAATRWMQLHAVSHRRLIREHQAAVVMWDAHLEYRAPLTFFDADELNARAALRVRSRGAQLEGEVDFTAGAALVAKLRYIATPLGLSDDPSLAGTPARLPAEILALFRPDETEPGAGVSRLPEQIERIEQAGATIATATTPFFVGREQCEMADQWFWPEAAALCARGRARAALAGDRRARSGLRSPLRSIHLIYRRPFFLLDAGRIETAIHQLGDSVAFVHRLQADADPPEAGPRALVVEMI
jgi:acyl-CoA thioesterase FadM